MNDLKLFFSALKVHRIGRRSRAGDFGDDDATYEAYRYVRMNGAEERRTICPSYVYICMSSTSCPAFFHNETPCRQNHLVGVVNPVQAAANRAMQKTSVGPRSRSTTGGDTEVEYAKVLLFKSFFLHHILSAHNQRTLEIHSFHLNFDLKF